MFTSSRRTARSAWVLAGVLAASSFAATAPAPSRAAGPLRPLQWGLDVIGADEAARVSDGRGVLVGVLDSGVDAGHPDLAGNVTDGPDFVDGDRAPADGNGHGTHVAGIIAAHAGNAVGGRGAAPGATVLNVRVLDNNEAGTTATVADGIDWAVAQGAKVLNLSLSAGAKAAELLPTDPLARALNRATSVGVTVVAAAGNDSLPLCAQPIIVPQLLCVGAVNQSLERSSFSNFGVRVDLVAPGGGSPGAPIISTLPGGQFGGMQGTSQATPFVAAAAADLAALGLSSNEIIGRITSTAKDLGQPGIDLTYGHGLLDLRAAVAGYPSIVPQSSDPPAPAPPDSPRPVARSAVVNAPTRIKVASFLRRGLRVRCSAAERGRCTVVLSMHGRTVGRGSSIVRAGATKTIIVRAVAARRRQLTATRGRSVSATLAVRAPGTAPRRQRVLLR